MKSTDFNIKAEHKDANVLIDYKLWALARCDSNEVGSLADFVPIGQGKAKSFEIDGDDFLVESELRNSRYRLEYSATERGFFGIHDGTNSKIRDAGLTIFTNDRDPLSFLVDGGSAIVLSAKNYRVDGDKIETLDRIIQVKFDNQTFQFESKPSGQSLPRGEDCVQFESNGMGSDRITLVLEFGISPVEILDEEEKWLELNLNSYSSVVDMTDVSKETLAGEFLGTAAYVTATAPNVKLISEMLEQPIEKSEATITLLGKFDVSTDDKGNFRFTGHADRIWVDGYRVSPTKWEILSDEWQRWLLAGLLAGLVAFLKWILPSLWRDRTKVLVPDS